MKTKLWSKSGSQRANGESQRATLGTEGTGCNKAGRLPVHVLLGLAVRAESRDGGKKEGRKERRERKKRRKEGKRSVGRRVHQFMMPVTEKFARWYRSGRGQEHRLKGWGGVENPGGREL